MTSDQQAILTELQKLKRELSVTVELFANTAYQHIAYIPTEVMTEVIDSKKCIERAIALYRDAMKEEGK